MDGGDGVEEGAAGEEERLDYHGSVEDCTNCQLQYIASG